MGASSPAALAEDVSDLGRFDDPNALLAAECEAVTEIASRAEAAGLCQPGPVALGHTHARSALAGGRGAVLFPSRRRCR